MAKKGPSGEWSGGKMAWGGDIQTCHLYNFIGLRVNSVKSKQAENISSQLNILF